jgi:hypothetical protein
MTLVRFGRWSLRPDREKTRAAYARLSGGSAEQCGCNICKNYVAARDGVWGAGVRRVLDQLGIDYRREAEVLHQHRIAEGRHAYSGRFHFIGAIESGRDAAAPRGNGLFALELEPAKDGLSLGFTARTQQVPRVFEGEDQVVQVEFEAIAPWLLAIDEPA